MATPTSAGLSKPDPSLGDGGLSPEHLNRKLVYAGFATVVLLSVLLAIARPTQALDNKAFDFLATLLSEHFPKRVPPEVVIVGIDEASFEAFPEPVAMWHRHLGKFLSAMAVARPKVVGIDVVLPTRSYDDLMPGLDGALLQGLLAAQKSTAVVIGQTIDERGNPRKIHAPFAAAGGQIKPGYVLLPEDSDGVIRRFSEHLGPDGAFVPTLPGQMARQLGAKPVAGWLDYRLGPQKSYIPLQQLVRWVDEGEDEKLRATFSGRVVMIGGVTLFEDRKRQPLNLVGWEADNALRVPGVLIHAQALRSIMADGLIQPAPGAAVAAAIGAACLLWFAPVSSGALFVALPLIVFALFALSGWLLWQGVHMPIATVALAATFALGGRWLLDSLLQMRERRMLRSVFGGYVSPQVMEEVLAGRLTEDLEGTLRTVCVMFADVRGFTTISANTAPQDVLRLLNRYFERVTAAVHAEGGTLNSIMGDGFMAIFGAPVTFADPVTPAFEAAKRILAFMPALNAELAAEGKPPLSVGIGLHVGEAIVGHVGSRDRHDYSAIGDTTNTASRLEGLTKEAGLPLVCSEAVFRALGAPAGFVDLGEREIRGRAPMHLYGWPSNMLTGPEGFAS